MPWTSEALALSQELADLLALRPGDVAPYMSRSRPGHRYEMVVTPDGYVVHQGEGCEGEPFNGPLGCHHSKNLGRFVVMTQALTQYEAAPPPMVFTEEHKKTLKNTICRGASDAELDLFVYACQDIGLNPFLKQIWAIVRNVNTGTKDNPKWEKQLTIQVGIDGYRAIRDRLVDGQGVALFEGMEGPQWSDDGEKWMDYEYSAKPKFARVAVYRRGISRPFIAVCRYEAYVQDSPLWTKMGAEQLGKCAEALAYRRAFPAQMGKLPSGPVAEYGEPETITEPPPAGYIEGELVAASSSTQPEAPASASSGSASASPGSTPPVREPTAPIDLLNAIAKKHGAPVATQARGIMPYLFGTGELLKLSNDQRHEFADMLRVWLDEPEHEHEPAFAPDGRACCGRCGVEIQEEPASESVGLGI